MQAFPKNLFSIRQEPPLLLPHVPLLPAKMENSSILQEVAQEMWGPQAASRFSAEAARHPSALPSPGWVYQAKLRAVRL